jgi:hypothetical protein
MKQCPKCLKEVPDEDWSCPFCGFRFPPQADSGSGHASSGTSKEDRPSRYGVSVEDKAMLKDDSSSVSSGDEEGYEPAQPTSGGNSDKYNY